MNKLIIVLVIILGILAVAQLSRVGELTKKRSNTDPGEIPDKDNRFNANMMLAFGILLFTSFLYFCLEYGFVHLGPAASVGGREIETLFVYQYALVIAIFIIFAGILFYFTWRYIRKPGVKAYYYSHNNTLELIWTAVPAVVLTISIIMGLKTWNTITSPAAEEAVNVEIFSQQFSWTVRYSGPNNKLGKHDFRLTTPQNPLGVKTKENIAISLGLMQDGELGNPGIKMIEEKLNDPTVVMSGTELEALKHKLSKKEMFAKSLAAMSAIYKDSLDALANDDVISKDMLVLLKGQKYNFHFRSKDVIHSAYMPQFRLQINTLPGMKTYFKMQPVYTSKEMKKIMDDPYYEFVLLCNKVCGGSHYKMFMRVKVLGPEDFLKWQESQTTYDGSPWIRGNRDKILAYYKAIASRVE